MKITQTAAIPAPIDQVWAFLDDVPSVATCMPGAQLTRTVDASTYEGLVKVTIGPLAMNYTGRVSIDDRNEDEYAVTMLASGRDRRGSGTAQAHVTARLTPDRDHTQLHINSDLQLTGRVASLGRGVQDVSNKLFAEFTERLASELQNSQSADGARSAAASSESTPGAHIPADQHAAAPLPHPPTAAAEAAAQTAAGQATRIKIGPLLWSITREKLAAFLLRLSNKVSP